MLRPPVPRTTRTSRWPGTRVAAVALGKARGRLRVDRRVRGPAFGPGKDRDAVRTFTLESMQWLPRPIGEVFPFFSEAANLQRITPPWLRFSVLTPSPIEMRVGTRIDYRLRVRGLPLRWQSEITAWEPPLRFADEQRRGPYRLWVHEHTFRELDGGTEVRDHVTYAVPGGRVVERLLVGPDVRRIFAFRRGALERLFPPAHGRFTPEP